MNFDPAVFGEGFRRFVQAEYELFGLSFGVFFHIAMVIILSLTFIRGNKLRNVYAYILP